MTSNGSRGGVGRPPLPEKEVKTSVALKVGEKDYALLQALAEKECLKFADIIRRAIRHYAEFLNVKL